MATIRVMPASSSWNATLAAVTQLEEKIAASEGQAIIARWEFGREMLKARQGKKKLPPGLLQVVMDRCRLGRSEIAARMQLAALFPTRQAIVRCIGQWKSWFEIVHHALPPASATGARSLNHKKRKPEESASSQRVHKTAMHELSDKFYFEMLALSNIKSRIEGFRDKLAHRSTWEQLNRVVDALSEAEALAAKVRFPRSVSLAPSSFVDEEAV